MSVGGSGRGWPNAEERARLWPRLVELYPPYEEYQSFTTREIPVVLLKPAG